MDVVRAIVFFLRAVHGDRAALIAENLALRQQLAFLQVSMKRPKQRALRSPRDANRAERSARAAAPARASVGSQGTDDFFGMDRAG